MTSTRDRFEGDLGAADEALEARAEPRDPAPARPRDAATATRTTGQRKASNIVPRVIAAAQPRVRAPSEPGAARPAPRVVAAEPASDPFARWARARSPARGSSA